MGVRKTLGASGLLSLTLLATVGLATAAGAAQTCEAPATTCFATTTETVTVEQPIPGTTANGETFRTRVIVQGPNGTAFDQTIEGASDSPAVADAITTATKAATADGLRVASVAASSGQRTLVDSSQTEVTTPDHDGVATTTETKFGPGTVNVGPDRSEVFVLLDGQTLFNTVTTTTHYVNVATNTTNTYRTTATVTIVAVAPSPATTTTASTTPNPAVAAGSADPSSGELVRTGSSTRPWSAVGMTLVIAGAACLHLSRRTAARR